jgi:hypothetical protein
MNLKYHIESLISAPSSIACRKETPSWPYQHHHIREVIDNCTTCTLWKRINPVIVPAVGTTAKQPMDDVQVDLISGLVESNTYKYILVHTCVFTNFVILLPLKDKSAQEIAKNLFHIWSILGTPKTYQADNDATMWAEAIENITMMFGVYHRKIAAYSPQRNGKVERKIQDISALIKKLTSQHGTEWPSVLNLVQMSLNNSSNASTILPFEIMFARKFNNFQNAMSPPVDDATENSDRSWQEWINHLELVQTFLFPYLFERNRHKNLLKQDESLVKSSSHLATDTLPIGTMVRILDSESKVAGNKSQSPILGVGKVTAHLGSNTYEITDTTGYVLERAISRQHLDPLNYLDSASKENDYLMERIVEHKSIIENGVREYKYKVRWHGYGPKEDTWQSPSDLPPDMVRSYIATSAIGSRTLKDPAKPITLVQLTQAKLTNSGISYSTNENSSASTFSNKRTRKAPAKFA